MTKNRTLYYLLVFYFLLFPFGQLGRFEFFGVTIQLLDIILGLFVVLWVSAVYKFNSLLKFPFLALIIVTFFSFAANITNVDQEQAFVGILYFLRFSFYILFYFAITSLIKKKIFIRGSIFRLLKLSGMYLIFFGVLQYLFFPDLRILTNWGWDNHYFRLVGTFLDPGYFGILAVLFVLLLLFKNLQNGLQNKERFFLFLGVASIAATYSRASFLAFLGGLVVLNFFKSRLKLTIQILLFFVLVLFFLPKTGGEGVKLERTSTISYRLLNYQESVEIFKKSPLFGIGFNFYASQKESSQILSHSKNGADASLLFILATTGIVGLIIYLSFLQKIISLKDPLLLASTFAILIHAFFHNTLFYPWVLGWWFTLIAGTVTKKIKE